VIVAFVATCIAPFPLSTADFDGASASDVSREYGAEASARDQSHDGGILFTDSGQFSSEDRGQHLDESDTLGSDEEEDEPALGPPPTAAPVPIQEGEAQFASNRVGPLSDERQERQGSLGANGTNFTSTSCNATALQRRGSKQQAKPVLEDAAGKFDRELQRQVDARLEEEAVGVPGAHCRSDCLFLLYAWDYSPPNALFALATHVLYRFCLTWTLRAVGTR
jgi:hypothetical protein